MTNETVSPPTTLLEALEAKADVSRFDRGQSGNANQAAPEGAMVGHSLLQIPVTLQVVLGSARLPLSRISELAPGAMLNLDQTLGEPATVLVNGREIAKGTLFVTEGEDERLGITITDIISPGRSGNAS